MMSNEIALKYLSPIMKRSKDIFNNIASSQGAEQATQILNIKLAKIAPQSKLAYYGKVLVGRIL